MSDRIDYLPGEYACCEETPCQWGDHPCERKSYPAADRERIYTKADAEALCEIAVAAALRASKDGLGDYFDGHDDGIDRAVRFLEGTAAQLRPGEHTEAHRTALLISAKNLRDLKVSTLAAAPSPSVNEQAQGGKSAG